MNWMLLVLEPTGQRAARGPEEGRVAYEQMLRFAEKLKSRGVLVGCNSLAAQEKGVRVAVRDGRPRLIDGPFAEAKEMVGGYFLLDCATREEAVAIAADCPAAEWCTIEVRHVAPCYE
ncbi:MAG: dehydrogenase [Proteobacteria bacterium]|nr:dehydrogenase [Burkholderiales bacterium]